MIGARLAGSRLRVHRRPALPALLAAQLLLLVLGGALAIVLGPFRTGDTWQAIATAMVLVAAMAIQNAAHRVHLGAAPPSTLMTGSTTQLMLDLADVIGARHEGRPAVLARMRSTAVSIGVFAVGCVAAAFAFAVAHMWCFAIPPVLAAASVALHRRTSSQMVGLA